MTKSLISIIVLALTFGVIESMTANAGVMNGEETCICIGRRSNGFNATGTRLNGTCARSQTGPFCFTEGGDGDGIMVVTDEQSYTNFCDTFENNIIAEAVCPEGKVLVAVDCETDPQIPQTDFSTIPLVLLNSGNTFNQSDFDNTQQPLTTSLSQFQRCSIQCFFPQGSGVSGTLTAVAFCEQP